MKFVSLTIRNMKEIYRDPVSIILGVVLPVMLLVLFSSIQSNIQVEIFSAQMLTPGMIVFSFTFLFMFAAFLIAKDRENAFLTRLFVSPLKPVDFIISYFLPFIPIAVFQIIICMIFGYFFGATYHNIVLSFCILLLTSTICISLGMIIGSVLNVNQVSGIGSFLITVIAIFSGAMMDLNMVGGVFKSIGYAIPFAHTVDIVRALLNGTPFSELVNHFWWIIAYSVVFFILAVFAFRTKTKMK
jgi:ABC-2 type transport system permease protein